MPARTGPLLRFTPLLAVALMIAAPTAEALPLVSATYTFPNETGIPANDFHIQVNSGGGTTIPPTDSQISKGPFAKAKVTSPVAGGFSIDFTNAVPNIPSNGPPITIGFDFRSTINQSTVTSFWTLNGVKIDAGTQPKLPGFKATHDQTIYTLINNTDSALLIHNLEFEILSTETPLDLLIPYTLPGFGAAEPDFVVPADSSMDFMPGDMTSGQYLLAQLTSIDMADPLDVVLTMEQHEFVSEPPSYAVLALGLLGLVPYRLRLMRNARSTLPG
jgi:hypothetical protein